MNTQPVTFAAMTDLHLDIMHDGMMRIDAFLDAAQKADVEFIIQLGDLSYPKRQSQGHFDLSMCTGENAHQSQICNGMSD